MEPTNSPPFIPFQSAKSVDQPFCLLMNDLLDLALSARGNYSLAVGEIAILVNVVNQSGGDGVQGQREGGQNTGRTDAVRNEVLSRGLTAPGEKTDAEFVDLLGINHILCRRAAL